jgi:hypothetical protein
MIHGFIEQQPRMVTDRQSCGLGQSGEAKKRKRTGMVGEARGCRLVECFDAVERKVTGPVREGPCNIRC